MRKVNLLLIVAVLFFGVGSAFAQLNDATVSGPEVKSSAAKNVEVHQTPVPMNQRAPRVNVNPMGAYEYGSYNYNACFSSGSTAGYVAAPNNFNENFDGAVEAWVYPTSATPSSPVIVGKGDALASSFLLIWVNTGSLGFRIGNTYTACTVTGNVPLNTWTHVAASWTGGPTFVITFYVNGVMAGTTVTNTGTWTVNTDSLTIGSTRAGFSNKDFVGYIDEVRLWSTARAAADIAANRFVGLGDGGAANAGNALTSALSYSGLTSSYTFNSGGYAYDDIGGYTGYYRNGAGPVYSAIQNNPLAYNFALKLSAQPNDFVTVPTNTVFDQTSSGSIDAWVKLAATGVVNTICSKGTSFATHNYAFYVTATNKLGINIGAHNYISTGPTVFVAEKWYHVAATWTGGPAFTVKLYVNGVQDDSQTNTLAMPTNSDPFVIGRYYSGNLFKGFIDEVRVWNVALTPAQITNYMFMSCRTGVPASCVAAYNFDGNLNNFSATTGINGSFNSGGTNYCRFSGFSNDSVSGPQTSAFIANTTTLNRTGTPNPFPVGYAVKLSNKAIADNSLTKDTLTFAVSRAITAVELFVSIQHTWVGDLTIILTAPNGTSKRAFARSGGGADNILTFFVDGMPLCSTVGFFAPYSHLAGPVDAFGTFGSANTSGKWVLSVSDSSSGDVGTILGWGLRFNNDNITGINSVSQVNPDKYELFQNYPNPFNPTTTIKYSISSNTAVKMRIYDVLGKEVATLVNQVQTAGTYKVDFDASKLSSGVYFYKLEAGQFTEVKKMTLLK